MDEGISEGQSLRSKLWAAVAQSKAIRAKEMQEKMRCLSWALMVLGGVKLVELSELEWRRW